MPAPAAPTPPPRARSNGNPAPGGNVPEVIRCSAWSCPPDQARIRFCARDSTAVVAWCASWLMPWAIPGGIHRPTSSANTLDGEEIPNADSAAFLIPAARLDTLPISHDHPEAMPFQIPTSRLYPADTSHDAD